MRTLPPSLGPLIAPALSVDAASVDALYGLEPVFQPGSDPRQRPLADWAKIDCPHCWQSYEIVIDLTLGDQQLLEDCQHCCRGLAIFVSVIDDGRAAKVHTEKAFD